MRNLNFLIKFKNKSIASYKLSSLSKLYSDLLSFILKIFEQINLSSSFVFVLSIFAIQLTLRQEQSESYYMLAFIIFSILNLALLACKTTILLKVQLPSVFLDTAFMLFVSLMIVIETIPFLLRIQDQTDIFYNFLNTSNLSSTVLLLLFLFYYFFTLNLRKIKLESISLFIIVPFFICLIFCQNNWLEIMINIALIFISLFVANHNKLNNLIKTIFTISIAIVLFFILKLDQNELSTNFFLLIPLSVFSLTQTKNKSLKTINLIFLILSICVLLTVENLPERNFASLLTFIILAMSFLYPKRKTLIQNLKNKFSQKTILLNPQDITILISIVLICLIIILILFDSIISKNNIFLFVLDQLKLTIMSIFEAPKQISWFFGKHHLLTDDDSMIVYIFKNFGIFGLWSILLLGIFTGYSILKNFRPKQPMLSFAKFTFLTLVFWVFFANWNFVTLFIFILNFCALAIYDFQTNDLNKNQDPKIKLIFYNTKKNWQKILSEVFRLMLILAIIVIGVFIPYFLIIKYIS